MKHRLGIWASMALGLVLLFAGIGKLIEPYTFKLLVADLYSYELATLGAPAFINIVTIAADLLPWLEVVIGLLLVLGIAVKFAASLSVFLIGSFIYYNGWRISQHQPYLPCSCFGFFERVFPARLSTVQSLYFDLALLGLVLVILLFVRGNFFANHLRWGARKSFST